MFSTFIQKFSAVARNLLPIQTAVAFLVLGVLVFPVPYLSAISPMLVLAAVYYWAIYRPDLVRPLAVFLLGLLNDVVNYFPIGLSAFVFLAAYQVSFSQRRFFVGQPFLMVWTGFAGIAVFAALLDWAALSVHDGHMVPALPLAMQVATTVAVFPLPAWVMIRLQRAFLTPR